MRRKMAGEFSRSIVSHAVALAMVNAVQKGGYRKGAMVASPVLAGAEKELFVKILSHLDARRRQGADALTVHEISSLFTFVYAKAAEAVTNLVNSQPNAFELLGMLDGKVPICADDRLTGYFKKIHLATDCAQAYLDWHAENAGNDALQSYDPMLPLCEALKWCFRLSCTVAIEKLETDGKAIPGV